MCLFSDRMVHVRAVRSMDGDPMRPVYLRENTD